MQVAALHGEREHVSICTQLFLTISVKHDELLVRLNVRSIRSHSGAKVQVPVPWMIANCIFTLGLLNLDLRPWDIGGLTDSEGKKLASLLSLEIGTRFDGAEPSPVFRLQ